jgi:hypothetical protein
VTKLPYIENTNLFPFFRPGWFVVTLRLFYIPSIKGLLDRRDAKAVDLCSHLGIADVCAMTRNRFMRVPKRIQVCLKKTPARPGYTENWLPVVVAVFPGFWTTSCMYRQAAVCDLICPRQVWRCARPSARLTPACVTACCCTDAFYCLGRVAFCVLSELCYIKVHIAVNARTHAQREHATRTA